MRTEVTLGLHWVEEERKYGSNNWIYWPAEELERLVALLDGCASSAVKEKWLRLDEALLREWQTIERPEKDPRNLAIARLRARWAE
jgi:hypothetical protein